MATGQSPTDAHLPNPWSIFYGENSKTKAMLDRLSFHTRGTDQFPLELVWGLDSRAPGKKGAETTTVNFVIKETDSKAKLQVIAGEQPVRMAAEGSKLLYAALTFKKLAADDPTECLAASLGAFCDLLRFNGTIPQYQPDDAASSSNLGSVHEVLTSIRSREMNTEEYDIVERTGSVSALGSVFYSTAFLKDDLRASRKDFRTLSETFMSVPPGLPQTSFNTIGGLQSKGWSREKATAGYILKPLLTDLFEPRFSRNNDGSGSSGADPAGP